MVAVAEAVLPLPLLLLRMANQVQLYHALLLQINLCITVAVRSVGSGNIYKIDTVAQKALTLTAGTTYTFDVSDSTVSSHPFKLSTTADGTHATPTAGTEYTTGVTMALLQLLLPSPTSKLSITIVDLMPI